MENTFLNTSFFEPLEAELHFELSENDAEKSEERFSNIGNHSTENRSTHSKSKNPFHESENLEENLLPLGPTELDEFLENLTLKKSIRTVPLPKRPFSVNSKYFVVKRRPRVFGQNFKRVKNYIVTSNNCLNQISKQEERLLANQIPPAEAGIVKQSEVINKSKTTEVLQKEPMSEKLMLAEMKKVSTAAIHRSDIFQKEIFKMYKTISMLEIRNRTSDCKQKEMVIELNVANQKASDAERQATIVINHTNQLEQKLEKAECKLIKYGNKLKSAKNEIAVLESNIQESKKIADIENNTKIQLLEELDNAESNKKALMEELLSVREKVIENERNISELKAHVKNLSEEKLNYQNQVQHLKKLNEDFEEEYQSLTLKYDEARKSHDFYKNQIEVQREKSKMMVVSTIDLEMEIREMHEELSKHRIEKENLSKEVNNLLQSLSQCRNLMENYKQFGEKMKIEKRFAEEKLLYFDNYNKVIENKKYLCSNLKKSQTENAGTENQKNKHMSIENSKSEVTQKELSKEDNDTLSNVSFISNVSNKSTAIDGKLFSFKGEYSFPPFLKTDLQKKQVSSFSDLMKDNSGIASALL